MKLKPLIIIAVLMTGVAFADNNPKEPKVTTLLLHHFLSSSSPTHVKFIEPWARKLEQASKGKIQVQIYPSMSMGGKPGELYRQVRDGSADIVWTLAGYTAGVFPRVEVYELPTVHMGDAVATNIAIKENFHMIKEDFKDVKPLLIHVHAGNAVHTVDKKIESLEDFKGLKLRTPSRTGGWYIKALGAEPVGMPLPSLPQALSTKVIDGGLVPFQVIPPLKLQQLTHFSAEGKGGKRFGTSVFLFLMNKEKFNSLPKELQVLIEKSVDVNSAKDAGRTWMGIETPGYEAQKNSKNSHIITIENEKMKEIEMVGQKVVEKWIKEVSKKGIDGQKLVDSAREAISKNSR